MLFCIFAKKETMTTVIIDTQSKEAKRLVDYLKTISYAKVIDESQKDTSKYDPDFVDKINKREKQASVKLDVDNLWK
jgi:hypothetical protein